MTLRFPGSEPVSDVPVGVEQKEPSEKNIRFSSARANVFGGSTSITNQSLEEFYVYSISCLYLSGAYIIYGNFCFVQIG